MLSNAVRLLFGIIAILGLLAFFLLQEVDFVSFVYEVENLFINFILNRMFRFVINDALAILLIYALFVERKYVVFAFWIQVFGFIFLLVPYFVLKLYFIQYNGPLINFLHRIILNPILIMLLIPAFYYQKRITIYTSKRRG